MKSRSRRLGFAIQAARDMRDQYRGGGTVGKVFRDGHVRTVELSSVHLALDLCRGIYRKSEPPYV